MCKALGEMFVAPDTLIKGTVDVKNPETSDILPARMAAQSPPIPPKFNIEFRWPAQGLNKSDSVDAGAAKAFTILNLGGAGGGRRDWSIHN